METICETIFHWVTVTEKENKGSFLLTIQDNCSADQIPNSEINTAFLIALSTDLKLCRAQEMVKVFAGEKYLVPIVETAVLLFCNGCFASLRLKADGFCLL